MLKLLSSGHTGNYLSFFIYLRNCFFSISHTISTAPLMTWAVILVAWLATLPQLMPQQQSEFFNWAITTILPAALRRGLSSLGLALPWSMFKGM